MKKVQAPTLEEAYEIASKELGCPVAQLQYEVIQYPSGGILGLFKKEAIIVASCKQSMAQKIQEAPQAPQSIKKPSESKTQKEDLPKETEAPILIEEDIIVESFFKSKKESLTQTVAEQTPVSNDELAAIIEKQLKELIGLSCFDIDVVEVDVRDNTALIFIDGEDAALLIGKEGYRYNALSYMLFNWLHAKYGLFIKLEIAEFLTSQQEMIRNYIKPVIENVERLGKGKTRYLDGILVQIALEQLRETFPDKYVAIKTSRDGKKFIVINEFKK